MMARLGKKQLELLIVCCSPDRVLMTPSAMSDALLKRGLLRERKTRVGARRPPVAISAAGLRAVADAMERGEIEPALERMEKDFAERRVKAAQRFYK